MRIRATTIIYVALAVLTAWAGLGAAAYFLLPDWPTRGQFGDVFGAVNALFSGLAFAGLIVAILLQREDLVLQREELTATREELARTAKAQEEQVEHSKRAADAQIQAAQLTALTQYFWQGDSAELMEARARVFNDPIDSRDASQVANYWQASGMMVRRELLPFWIFEGSSGIRVVQFHERLETFINERRKENKYYAEHFTWLRDKVLEWQETDVARRNA